jgi:hypothetical protein
MIKRVVLVGSMTFQVDMQNLKRQLSDAGWLVFAPGDESGGQPPPHESEKAARKVQYDVFKIFHDEIEVSDAVLCCNFDKKGIAGYIGANAFAELAFGAAMKKKLYALYSLPDIAYIQDELTAMQITVLGGNILNLPDP